MQSSVAHNFSPYVRLAFLPVCISNYLKCPEVPFFFFFLKDTPTPEISPLPLHAALPIKKGAAAAARRWSATAPGKDLLAAIFGNSPFLSGLAIAEWGFLTHLVAEGPDPLFEEIVTEIGRAHV